MSTQSSSIRKSTWTSWEPALTGSVLNFVRWTNQFYSETGALGYWTSLASRALLRAVCVRAYLLSFPNFPQDLLLQLGSHHKSSQLISINWAEEISLLIPATCSLNWYSLCITLKAYMLYQYNEGQFLLPVFPPFFQLI